MADSKEYQTVAGDITSAWLKAKADLAIAGAGTGEERRFPSAEEVATFYEVVAKKVLKS
ncbi:hypothetical protein [Paenibacillus wynnii]|uniref:hypothetical protein n=1 Tax=Paenibacillus wynnii TaxID=268407 RepID=UPI000B1164FD|nr:hypothetical protein [Paenibacillus wynnii]